MTRLQPAVFTLWVFSFVNNHMENTTTQSNNIELNLQDLRALKTLVEVACQRGAYRADEMKAIGTVYDRIAGFLAAVEANQSSSDTESSATPPTEPSA